MLKLSAADKNDPLGDVLGAVRFRSTIFCRSEMTAPWGFRVDGRDIATFHFVEIGSCWLAIDGSPAQNRLSRGDFVILPHGHAHAMRDAPDSKAARLEDLLSEHPEVADGTLRFGGGGPTTSLICGGFFFEIRNALPFLPALPPMIHVREQSSRVGSWIRVAQEAIATSSGRDRVCENTILSRVADLIFIEAVRSHFTDAAGSPRGWFAALGDQHVGRAISLIHREPQRPWTVLSLASAVGMSRTAFAIRFSLLLGESPMRYVARRRIARAVALLENGTTAIARIGYEVGYESEVAFSKAFKRHVGLSPAAYRQGLQNGSAAHTGKARAVHAAPRRSRSVAIRPSEPVHTGDRVD